MDSVSIDDIGNVIIEGFNDDGDRYVFIVRTVLGVSRMLKVGPIQDGAKTMCSSLFQQMEYNEKKIDREIDAFLNDGKCLTQVSVLDIDQLKPVSESLPNVVELMYD